MSKNDFKKMTKYMLNKLADFEVEMLFKHFDASHKGSISKSEFLDAFTSEAKEQ